MDRRNRGLECIRARRPAAIAQRGLDQRRTLVDLCAVPARSVLLLEQHDLAGPIEAALASRVVQQHEREQSLRLGVSRQQLDQHAPEPDRLLTQIVPHQPIAEAGGVALV